MMNNQFRCSLVGQDIRLSPERPGFKSRQRKLKFLIPSHVKECHLGVRGTGLKMVLCYLGITHWARQPSSNLLFGYHMLGDIGLFSPVQTILFSCIMDGGLFSPRKGMSRLGKSFQNKLRAKKAYCFHKATPNQVENITQNHYYFIHTAQQ